MGQGIPVHGVTQQRVVADEIDARVEELDRLGYTTLESGLDEPEIVKLGRSLDRIYERQVAEAGDAALAASNDVDIARAPLAYDADFVAVAANRALVEMCRRVFGENFVLLQQNGVINRAASPQYQSRWHRDFNYQHFTISRKLALNALLCLDPFTEDTGGTYVLPGSHLVAEFPSDSFVRSHEHAVAARPGTWVVLDAMLYHRAGENRSNAARRGVNHVIGMPLLAQQIDLPRMLAGKYADDSFLARYFGYRWNPAPDVTTWRASRGTPRGRR